MSSADNLPLVRGTADLLVLKALSWGPRHGFGISSWLGEHSQGIVEMDDSAMYQVLHRLEERDLVEAEWAVTENNRKARYYRLTQRGRRFLREETESWLQRSRTVTSILTLTSNPDNA